MKIVDQYNQPLANVVVGFTHADNKSPANYLAIMDQVDKQFVPHVLIIDEGQRVQFPNSDNIRHHVYSFSKAKPFEIKLYSGTPSNPVQFNDSGLVALGCNIHDQMIGYIYVRPTNERAILSNQLGEVEIPKLSEVQIWHPKQQGRVDTRQRIELPKAAWQEEHYQITLPIQEVMPAKSNKFKSRFK
ncbi:methylamine utilization protein [Catenovulum sediminis]|uniref:Methylamine utilization protein n=1 Tax=Catenovulum sediminis TaxID=1740262 RepID=A0ABV1RMN9_9ALTE|nr:methylamine utilization protein [Catenovulum sediminis]